MGYDALASVAKHQHRYMQGAVVDSSLVEDLLREWHGRGFKLKELYLQSAPAGVISGLGFVFVGQAIISGDDVWVLRNRNL